MAKLSYLVQVKRLNDKTFSAKERARKIWAKMPISKKIAEVVRMQKAFVILHPKYKNILPWRI